MAARARSKRLVRLLLEYGADPKLRNKEGKNAEDYIIEDERFRASPGRASAAVVASLYGPDGTPILPSTNLHTSEAGQRASGRTVQLMTKLLHQLADSYDTELTNSDKRLAQANNLLAQIQQEISESDQVRQGLEREAHGGEQERKTAEELNGELAKTLGKRSAGEMMQSWNQAQDGIKRARMANGLAEDSLLPSSASSAPTTGDPTNASVLLAPTAPGKTIEQQITEIRSLVAQTKAKHSSLVQSFIAKAREQGTGKTMTSYRRLISAGCGGIQASPDEVDAVVTALCELLEGNQNGTDSSTGKGEDSIRPQDATAMLRGVAHNQSS